MKLPTLTTIFGLTSLFTSFTTATIAIKDLAPTLKAGSWHDVQYSSDRDYVSSRPVYYPPLSTHHI